MYSYPLLVEANTTYSLHVTDFFGEGLSQPGWFTITTADKSILMSYSDGEKFSEVIIELALGSDGLVQVIMITTL